LSYNFSAQILVRALMLETGLSWQNRAELGLVGSLGSMLTFEPRITARVQACCLQIL